MVSVRLKIIEFIKIDSILVLKPVHLQPGKQ